MASVPTPIPLRRGSTAPTGPSAFERLGPEACGELDLLAAVLGGNRRGESRVLALVARFGSLAAVGRATPAELREAGLEHDAAVRLAAGVEIGRRLMASWPDPSWVVRTPADVADRLLPSMSALEREELHVLLLDSKNVIRAQRTVYVGNLAGSAVRIGEVFRDAVRNCAASLVVVHNHPSGDPAPSGEDLRITAELASAGRLLDIELLDHLIVGRDRWVSLRAIGALGQPPATMR
jgi:DNA repair protein RadC